MRLCVVFALVALASADVSELPGYKYSGGATHQHASSAQYASQFGSGTLEVIPLNLAHVSTTVHRAGEAGLGKGSEGYTSSYSNSQYTSGAGYTSNGPKLGSQYYNAGASQYSSGAYSGGQYPSGANLGSQYSSGANLGSQYSSGANLGSQYSSGANLGGQYSSGANLGGQYSSGANLVSQYSSGANLGSQYSLGAGLGAQYTTGAQLSSGASFTDSADIGQSSGFTSQGGNGASFAYHQLINDVLSGKYTVGSYSPSAYTASSQRQKININIQPNQAPVTYRHVYFAEAPAEAPIRPRIHIEGAIQPRKHVKVVFIKTPDLGGVADQELTLPQLEEEKTQIYVLSKEHNQQPQIRIKAGNAGTASRPEIFFLKYRNEADALKAQQVLRENAGKDGFTAGNVLTDTNLSSGFSGGQASGFSGSQASGASSSGFTSGLASGISSGLSGSSNNAFASGLSTGLSSGFSNSASSFQSGGSIDGGSLASAGNIPLKETNYASSGSKGVTTLYGAPSVGDASSGGYIKK